MTVLLSNNPEAAERTLRYAAPGQVFSYHVGRLAGDRRVTAKNLHPLASRMYGLYERGMIELLQRRLGSSHLFEYLAVRKQHRVQP